MRIDNCCQSQAQRRLEVVADCQGCGAYHEEGGAWCYECQWGLTRSEDEGLASRWPSQPDRTEQQIRACVAAMREPVAIHVLYNDWDYGVDEPGCVAIVDRKLGADEVEKLDMEGLTWILVEEVDARYSSGAMKSAMSMIGDSRVLKISGR